MEILRMHLEKRKKEEKLQKVGFEKLHRLCRHQFHYEVKV